MRKHRGVKRRDSGSFGASIKVPNLGHIYLGSYDNKIGAIDARLKAEVKYGYIDIHKLTIEEIIKKSFRYEDGKVYRTKWHSRYKIGDEVGYKNKTTGYRFVEIKGKGIPLHRVIWYMLKGVWPQGQIDHINGVRDDNRIENLRDVSQQVNQMNTKTYNTNSSGCIGIRSHKNGRYEARITFKGVTETVYSGYDLFEACCARKSAEIRLGFHENHGRLK